MFKKSNVQKIIPKKETINKDLNRDGIVDHKDMVIASKVLNHNVEAESTVKEVPKPVIGEKGYLLKKPLTCDLRDGMILSMDKYDELKSRGIDIDSYL